MNLSEDKIDRIALWKYGLAIPIINQTHGYESDIAYCRAICQTPLTNPVTGQIRNYSPNTIRDWAFQYRHNGIDALRPSPRNDTGVSRVLSSEAQQRILELKIEKPKMPCTLIRETLMKEKIITAEVSLSTINRFVNAQADILAALREERQKGDIHEGKERKAFEQKDVNAMWQADTTFLKEIDGKKVCLQMIIDDCSRMIVGYGFFFEDNKYNFMKVLKKAIQIYGKPTILYCDNGGPYSNKQLHLMLAALGIQLVSAPIRDGAAKGKVERANRTVKTRWLSKVDWDSFQSLDEIEISFQQYLNTDYHNSEHSALKNDDELPSTPRDKFFSQEKRIRKVPQDELDEAFLIRDTRKVKTDSTLQFDNVIYEVPAEYMREKVEIYINPWDSSQAWFKLPGSEGPRQRMNILNKIDNAHIKRKQHISYKES